MNPANLFLRLLDLIMAILSNAFLLSTKFVPKCILCLDKTSNDSFLILFTILQIKVVFLYLYA